MDELRCVMDALAVMSEAERLRAFRTIDGPARRQKEEKAWEYRPLPSMPRRGVTVRVKVTGA